MESTSVVIAVLSLLVALWALSAVRRRRWRRRWGHGYGPRGMLRWIFHRLDTSPGQENAVVEAVEELRAALGEARGDLGAWRGEVAQLLRGERLDEDLLQALFDKRRGTVDAVRKAAARAGARIHQTLDDRQRKLLAELIERGPVWRGGYAYGC